MSAYTEVVRGVRGVTVEKWCDIIMLAINAANVVIQIYIGFVLDRLGSGSEDW